MSMIKKEVLERLSRPERLRDIIRRTEDGQTFSAFDLAVLYDVSLNVVYRDIKELKDSGLISESFSLTRRGQLPCIGV